MRYNILSPDGFPISHTPFTSKKKALAFFNEWKKVFTLQGYYSTSNREHILPEDLDRSCDLITL